MDAVRIDKRIWAARFFKTRGLATQAVIAGHVHLNHARVKPAKDVHVGDELEIRIGTGTTEWTVTVEALSDKRGPAKVAQGLYSETDASRVAREQEVLQRKLAAPPVGADLGARPTKQDRRRLDSLRRAQRVAGKWRCRGQLNPWPVLGYLADRKPGLGATVWELMIVADETFEGQCLCGAVTIEVTGEAAGAGTAWRQLRRIWSAGRGERVHALARRCSQGDQGRGAHRRVPQQRAELSPVVHGLWWSPADPPSGWGLVDVYAATIPSFPFTPGVHVNYESTMLPMKDGLPKLKDFPAELGGSVETLSE